MNTNTTAATTTAATLAVTLFYSNESGNCKALIQFLNSVNIMDKLTIKFINIDNKPMRSVVMKKITSVPAITVLNGNQLSLYSGENVFEWFNLYLEIISKKEKESINSTKTDQIEHSSVKFNEPLPQSNDTHVSSTTKKSILEIASELSKARENF